MSKLLNSGKVDKTTFENMKKQRAGIVNKWKESGLLEGLNGIDKTNIALLLESPATQYVNKEDGDIAAKWRKSKLLEGVDEEEKEKIIKGLIKGDITPMAVRVAKIWSDLQNGKI